MSSNAHPHTVAGLASVLAACLIAAAPIAAAQAGPATSPAERAGDARDAQKLVNEAVGVIAKMKQDPKLVALMRRAKGLYIVPEFGRGGLIVGGRGGAGLVVVHKGATWTSPAFYDFGGISLGAQIGGSGGSVVFLLMTPNAVDAFRSGNKISLNAGAGLSIINYSANSQASWGKGDIIMWSDTHGAYAGATVSATDINWDDGNNRAYYGRNVDTPQVLNGRVNNPGARRLEQILPR